MMLSQIPVPGGENQLRPKRPRPAVCVLGQDHRSFVDYASSSFARWLVEGSSS